MGHFLLKNKLTKLNNKSTIYIVLNLRT